MGEVNIGFSSYCISHKRLAIKPITKVMKKKKKELPSPLDRIAEAGIVSGGRINRHRLWTIGLADLITAVSYTFTADNELIRHDFGMFSHAASGELAGSRFPCACLSCRVKRIRELAQFTAFYADKTVVADPFADSLNRVNFNGDAERTASKIHDSDDFRAQIEDDLVVLLELRPLIDAGIVCIAPDVRNICFDCLATLGMKRRSFDVVNQLRVSLSTDILATAKGVISTGSDGYFTDVLLVDSPGAETSVCTHYYDLPQVLSNQPSLLRRLQQQGSVTLSKANIRRLRICFNHSESLIRDTLQVLLSATLTGSSPIVSRSIEVKMLEQLADDSELEERNMTIRKHLSLLLPFVPNIRVGDVLRMREENHDSFIRFRSALDSTVREALRDKQSLSDRDAKLLYTDVIQPELSELTIKYNNAIQSIKRSQTSSAIGWLAALSFGACLGLATHSAEVAASAIGAKMIGEVAGAMSSRPAPEDDIKSNKFYFAWRIKRAQ